MTERGTIWILPEGATTLDVDGKQLWYATDHGTGTCVGEDVTGVSIEWDAEFDGHGDHPDYRAEEWKP